MKRNLAYLIIILVLAVVAWWALTKRGAHASGKAAVEFAVKDTGRIGVIFLADMDNHRITLERQEDGSWLLNDKYRARKPETETLLRTIAQIRVKNPVAESARENIIKSMATQNTKVEIYDCEGDLMKAYYVGPPTESLRGNYMKLEGSEKIYVVHIPGFEGELGPRYFTDENNWRDRTVFNLDPEDFRQVTVQYTGFPDSSFTLRSAGRDSFVLLQPGDTLAYPFAINQKAARTYAAYFQSLKYEALINQVPGRDSIIASQPFCVVRLEGAQDNVQELKLFYKPADKRTKGLLVQDNEGKVYDRDRYYGLITGGKDLVLIQDFVFGKILQTPPFFKKGNSL